MQLKNNAMTLQPATDVEALEITNFATGQEISYQIYEPQDAKQITLQYCGYSNAICEILVDGVSQNYIDMPRNGSSTEWTEATSTIALSEGKHTITLSLYSGSCSLSAIILK